MSTRTPPARRRRGTGPAHAPSVSHPPASDHRRRPGGDERHGTAGAASLGQLHDQLGAQQAHEHSLASSISSLNHLIDGLDAQIALVENREAAVSSELADDRAKLAKVQQELVAERRRLVILRHRLAIARQRLSRQLVGSYEQPSPT